MNPEIKIKWLAALRSGDYEQGRARLNKDGKFCCLGVLCDLFGKEMNVPWREHPREKGTFMMEGASALLPLEVMQWASVSSPSGALPQGGPTHLTGYNDTGKPFLLIADLIEKYL